MNQICGLTNDTSTTLNLPDISQKCQQMGGLLAPQTALGPGREKTEERET